MGFGSTLTAPVGVVFRAVDVCILNLKGFMVRILWAGCFVVFVVLRLSMAEDKLAQKGKLFSGSELKHCLISNP